MSATKKNTLLAIIWVITFVFTPPYFWASLSDGAASIGAIIFQLLFTTALGMIGSVMITRQAHNIVGWIFFAAFCYQVAHVVLEVSILFYLARFSEAAPGWASVLAFVDAYNFEILSEAAWFALLFFPILYFPDGVLPSRRWRMFVRVTVILFIVRLLVGPFDTELPSPNFPDFHNPLAVPLATTVMHLTEIPLLFATVAAPVSLLLRYRRATGIERQQIKWPLFSASLFLVEAAWIGLIFLISGSAQPEEGDIAITIAITLEQLAILSFPITIGFAMLRYRLYDIDIIISRTLLYSTLTASLALVYFASVALLQRIFPVESPIAVVLSTLAVAALFAPLRRRLQDVIDRRFYRQKYNASQALAAFGATARDEVDLDRLSEALAQTIVQTLHPSELSLWLSSEEDAVTRLQRR